MEFNMYSIGKPSKQGFIFCASVLATLLAACGGGGGITIAPTATATPSNTPTGNSTAAPTATSTPIATTTQTPGATATNTPAPTASNTPVPTATATPTATIATTPAQLNPVLLGSFNKAFYQGNGAGCGTVCSYTEGQTVSVALLAGNILSLDGRQLSNPYFRILGGSPHTPEIIWRDGDIEYALTNNDSGLFSEINVGDLTTPVNGFPRYLGQIRDVVTIGIANVTQFAGTYNNAFQYNGPNTGAKRPQWTSLTIAQNGAITFTGGGIAGGNVDTSISASQMTTINDFTGCCGKVQISFNQDINGDGAVNSYDQIRLFENEAGELFSIEYDLNNSTNNYIGALLGSPPALPAQVNAAIPTSNQIAGTAAGALQAFNINPTGNFSFSQASQGGFGLVASSGANEWRITANHKFPLAINNTFSCQRPDTNSNRHVTMSLTVGSNTYLSTEGGRCQITLTNVTFDAVSGNVTSLEGRFVAEMRTFKRNLPPLLINDGVFRWVKP